MGYLDAQAPAMPARWRYLNNVSVDNCAGTCHTVSWPRRVAGSR